MAQEEQEDVLLKPLVISIGQLLAFSVSPDWLFLLVLEQLFQKGL